MATDIDTRVFGSDSNGGIGLEVDRTHKAARVAMRPLEYASEGVVLGHYRVAQKSGAVAATLGALAHAGSFRWADLTRYAVLTRIRAGYSVTSAVTTATPMDLRAIIARGFSVDFTTNATAISLAAISNTNKMRASMGASLMTTVGPRIMTTVAMSGQTLTEDAAPIGMTVWKQLHASTATGTAVALPVGAAGPMQDVYVARMEAGEYPVVLTANEGVLLQPVTACFASGTFAYYFEWTWAEVVVF